MVLEKLGESLKKTLAKITKAVYVDEKLINELVKDMQRALLAGDVNVKLVFNLTKGIKERIMKEETPPGITKKEHLIKIVYDALVDFLGGEFEEIKISKKPTKLMMIGLFGNGKTTTAGKLAKYYKKRGKKVAVISLDVWRPAAFEQLKQLAAQIDVPVFGDPKQKDPSKIWKKFSKEFSKYDLLIVDTAGRDALNDELITELNVINKIVEPDETLLVMGADVGQVAQKQAEVFHSTCKVTGVVITKLDGTAKGGGALAACSVTGAKVKFVGVGEGIDALEIFDPKRFVGKLLGMGDLEGLLEKAQEAISVEDAQDMSKRMMSGDFTLIDLYSQMQAMKKMGPISKIMEMVPGMGNMNIPKDALNVQQEKLEKWKFIIDSCTKYELENPEEIGRDRAERIATGAGVDVPEVREMLKQYKQSKKMVRMMKGSSGGDKAMQKMMGKMKQVKFR